MKKYIKYVAAIAAMVLGTSCTQELFHDRNSEGDTFSVEAIWSAMETKSAGVDNENKVSSLDYYFFKDATSAAVFHVREEIAAAQQTAKSYKKDFVPGTDNFPAKSELWGTWGEETGVHVFIVANLPSAKVLASPTLEEIKTVSVDETFLDEDDNPLAVDANGLFFIMTGEATLKGTTIPVESAEPEVVDLYRLAAKITYDVKVQKSRTETANGVTETWTPMLGGQNVRMYPQGAVKDAYLGVVDGEHYLDTPNTFNYPSVTVSSSDNPSAWEEGSDYYQMKETLGPYYTYPNNWEEGGADTFIKIIIPWQVTKTDSNGNVTYSAQREVYYKVVVPDQEILANHWYQLDITLAPGTENEPEVEVEAEYRVADWIGGGEEGVDGVLKDIKYLIADRSDEVSEGDDNHFVTYTRGISIPYSASNPVIFKVIEASYVDFSTEDPTVKKFVTTNAQGKTTYTNPNPGNNRQKHLGTTTDGEDWTMVQNLSTVESWFKFDNGTTVGEPNGYLVMDHWLNGNLTSDYFDVSPYTFTVRIYLQRDPENYVEELKIVQYPQTYIEAQESTIRGRESSSQSARFWGYIFINGKRREDNGNNTGSGSPWTTIMYCGGSGQSSYSTNHNMYILTTGVLSDSTKRLGDPREETSYNSPKLVGNNENGTPNGQDKTEDFITAAAVGGGTKTLSNYYPTDPAKSPTFIAPKLRISSAFGRRGSNNAGSNDNDDYRYNYASAWNRCAAYQEDGYPAGRWRLPTEAEIDYINRLSQRDFIPSLFYGSTPYWTATPGVAVNGSGTQNVKSASTRCVYDDWYWGSDPVDGAQNTFMWGD